MIEKHTYFEITCDGKDCNRYTTVTKFERIREFGWAVSRDRKKCYCTNCKKFYTRGIKKNEIHN